MGDATLVSAVGLVTAPQLATLSAMGSALGSGLAATLSASLEAIPRIVGSFALAGVIMRRERSEPFGLFDLGCIVVAATIMVWLGARIVRPRVATVAVRRFGTTHVDAPTSSLVHVVFDLAFIAMGATFLYNEHTSGHRPDGHTMYGLGLGFLGATVPHLGLRIAYWRRRPPVADSGLR